LAIEAIKKFENLSGRAAAKLYNIPKTTLRNRMNGATPLAERRPGTQPLILVEEEVIVQVSWI
jgi:hypothetical protein